MYLRLILAFILVLACRPAIAQNAPNPPSNNPAPEEVTLETNVVQIILNDEHRGGVDWGAIVSDFHTDSLKKANDPLWNDQKYRLSFGTLSEDDYTVLLDALDMAGEVTQYPQTPVKIIVGSPTSVSFDKQNIRVRVLLTRTKSGDLFVHLEPQIAIAATELFNGERLAASVPLATQTKIAISDNPTVVIGGFMKEEEIKKTHKFPLLGDIPIVGLVFRSHGRLMQKTETVVFLTIRTNASEAPEDDESSS